MSAPNLVYRGFSLSRKEQYEKRTWDNVLPICEQLGIQLVDTEFTKEGSDWALTVFIDKDGGVGVDDCQAVSDALNPILDEQDYIAESYTLYVSSPGLGRKLRRPHDFEWAVGKEVEIRTYQPLDGQKEFRGILKDWDADQVTIVAEDRELTIRRKDISLIRTAFDF